MIYLERIPGVIYKFAGCNTGTFNHISASCPHIDTHLFPSGIGLGLTRNRNPESALLYIAARELGEVHSEVLAPPLFAFYKIAAEIEADWMVRNRFVHK